MQHGAQLEGGGRGGEARAEKSPSEGMFGLLWRLGAQEQPVQEEGMAGGR